KGNSYTKMYPLIDSRNNLLELEKGLTKINPKTISKDGYKQIEDAFEKIEIIIDELKKPKAKRYLAARNIIYTYINRSWNNVSFLNIQDKELDPYKSYAEYFIKPVIQYLEKD
ncbi:type I-B CRISPR-associated protein Cas8b1/Cst1, partial [Vibrio parahaemolyticus]|nr:type I-B CRISPR-associated protein Cas8b1/Cst1 [Vibrio parahaemolyticus]